MALTKINLQYSEQCEAKQNNWFVKLFFVFKFSMSDHNSFVGDSFLGNDFYPSNIINIMAQPSTLCNSF